MNKDKILSMKFISNNDYLSLNENDKNDLDIIKHCLSLNSGIYGILSRELRNNPYILKYALSGNIAYSNPIKYALDGALSKENIDLAISKGIDSDDVSDILLLNKYFLVNYFANNKGLDVYRRLNESMKNNIDIVKIAVIHNPILYGELNEELRNDPVILKNALSEEKNVYVNPIRFALIGALSKENIDKAIENGIKVEHISDLLLKNKYFLVNYFKYNTAIGVYKKLDDEYKNDIDIVLSLIGRTPSLYGELSSDLRNNPLVLKTALESDISSYSNPLKYALEGALTNENIDYAFNKRISPIDVSDVLLKNKYFLIKYFSNFNGEELYKRLSDEYKDDINIVIPFISNSPSSFGELSSELRNNPLVLKNALTSNYSTMISPIKYALKDALTEENINLAIERGINSNDINDYLLNDENFLIKYFNNYRGENVYNKLDEKYKNNVEIVLALMKRTPFIYDELSSELRNNPLVLKAALMSKETLYSSPIKYALEGALTEENINIAIERGINPQDISSLLIKNKSFLLKYIERNASLDIYKYLPLELKNDFDIVKMLVNNKPSIYSELSSELRNDKDILESTLRSSRISFIVPIKYALDDALTKENIDLFFNNFRGIHFPYSDALLRNKYYVMKTLELDDDIFKKASKEIRSDEEVIRIALLFHPSLIYSIEVSILNSEMIEYAINNGLKIKNEHDIPSIILSNESFVDRFINMYPNIYTKLDNELRSKEKYIDIVLDKDGSYLKYVPLECINDKYILKSINNGYKYCDEHYDKINNFINKLYLENKEELFNIFLNSKDHKLDLLIVKRINRDRDNLSDDVNNKINNIIESYIIKFQELGISHKDINRLMNCLLKTNRNILNIDYIESNKDVLYICNFDDFVISDNHKLLDTNMLSFDTLNKMNSKHFKEFKNTLLKMGIDNINSINLAFKIYNVLGYARGRDLINNKYGNVDFDKLNHLFASIDISDVFYNGNNNNYTPILNNQIINLLFDQNYKIKNTPIKNYLNNYSDMELFLKQEINKINGNTDLSDDKKEGLIKELYDDYNKYCSDLTSFIANFSNIYSSFNIIEEEFYKKQVNSKLKVKLNINQINELYKVLLSIRKNNKKKLSIKEKANEKMQSRFSRIPDYEPRDYPLIESDVFDYVGYQNQFVQRPEDAPRRVVEISRMMENNTTKKFPNINLDFGDYQIGVYSPQDRNILSAGYKSGCCLRANGNADNYGKNNSFLVYCATNPYGGGLEIKDKSGRLLMFSPLLRNGNVLMLHSFETIGLNSKDKDVCNELIQRWTEEVLKKSKSEESEDEALVAVVITNLQSEFDKQICVGELPYNKKFKYYDKERKYKEMYNNLDGNSHYVISYSSGKNSNDIKYDYDVSHDYVYPLLTKDSTSVTVSSEECEIIKKIILLRNEITKLSNERYKLNNIKKYEEQSYELLRIIKQKQETKLLLMKKLYLINPNSMKDILSDYISAYEGIISVCNKLGVDVPNNDYVQIIYSNGWYIGVTPNNEIEGNFIKGCGFDYFNAFNGLKKSLGIVDGELSYVK